MSNTWRRNCSRRIARFCRKRTDIPVYRGAWIMAPDMGMVPLPYTVITETPTCGAPDGHALFPVDVLVHQNTPGGADTMAVMLHNSGSLGQRPDDSYRCLECRIRLVHVNQGMGDWQIDVDRMLRSFGGDKYHAV